MMTQEKIKEIKKVKVALIGHGHLGKWHAEKLVINPDCELTLVVDHDSQKAQAIKQKYPLVQFATELKSQHFSLFDAAIVVVPTKNHFKVVQDLLHAHKHVFCEKPLCQTYEEAQILDDIRQKISPNNLIFQVGHSERLHLGPQCQNSLKELVETTDFIHIERHGVLKYRALDVDVISDLVIHDADLIFNIYGQMPESIYAIGHKWISDEWDQVACQLAYPSGLKVYIQASRGHYKEVRKWKMRGKNGIIKWNLFNNKIEAWASSIDPIEGSYLTSIFKETYDKRDHLLIEQEHFFQSILKGKETLVSFEEGKQMVQLIQEIRNSLNSTKVSHPQWK